MTQIELLALVKGLSNTKSKTDNHSILLYWTATRLTKHESMNYY